MHKSKGRLNRQTGESVWNTFSTVSTLAVLFFKSIQTDLLLEVSLFHHLEHLHPIHT
jgi:hypothetical protein